MTQEPNITVRRASPDDAGLLAELGASTFQETFAADNTTEDMAAYLNSAFNLRQQTAELADGATFFIAEVDAVTAGYTMLRAGRRAEGSEGTGTTIELVRLYVSRKWLGRGVGEALMRVCLDEATRAGYRTIWLGVWERNARAQAFYRKWKFRAVGKHVFQLGSDAQTDILMERAI